MDKKYNTLKYACYTSNISMSAVGNLSPILFITFRSTYGISYSLLGLLVLINFVTQLTIDLIFSFFSHKFNIPKTLKVMPLLAVAGFIIYGFAPFVFPNNVYLGLALGTIVFSASSGLNEVLLSPVIAAIPSKNPEREMSKLHSIYAWGVVGVIVFCTLFLLAFGHSYWQVLPFALTLVPLSSFLLFQKSQIPHMQTPERTSGAVRFLKNKMVWLCVTAIFLGGASELCMAQWCSGYLEKAMGIPKVWGDLFGAALFAAALGFGRTLYAKYGKNITTFLFTGCIGATLCYLVAAICEMPVIGLIACGATGLCVSMLWPGTLIVAEKFFPTGGVLIFALMAAGGDLGASVGPQLVGIVTDAVIASPKALELATALSLTPDKLGMKLGMLVGMLFPLMGIVINLVLRRQYNKKR